MRRAIGTALGAIAGLAFSTMGLIDGSDGFSISPLGGNENTPVVIAVGVTIGALVGATLLWRWPLAIVGLIIGLLAGIWFRDNSAGGGVQAPWVFLLLFGLPAVGAAGGYLLHLPRTLWARHPTEGGALAGLAAAALAYAAASMFWTSATHDPACDPVPQPDGSVVVPLCSDPGTPWWIPLLATLVGVAVGVFAFRWLERTDTSSDEL